MKKNILFKTIWWIYIVMLFSFVILKFRGSFEALSIKISSTPFGTNYNLIPFASIGEQFSHFSEGWARINILGNLIPFIPFGFLLPLAYPKTNIFLKSFIIGLSFILFCELFQFFTRLGSFDVDDIILNLVGIFCGFLLGYIFHIFKNQR